MYLYKELLKAGIEHDNYNSDLYFKVTEESTKILNKYPNEKRISNTFKDFLTGNIWYDVPFAFSPYWDKIELIKKAVADVRAINPNL